MDKIKEDIKKLFENPVIKKLSMVRVISKALIVSVPFSILVLSWGEDIISAFYVGFSIFVIIVSVLSINNILEKITKSKIIIAIIIWIFPLFVIVTFLGIDTTYFCGKIPFEGTQNFCLTSNAEIQKNILICYNIQTTYDRDFCMKCVGQRSHNPEDCKKIEGFSLRDTCYIGVAEDTRNFSLCDFVISYDTKIRCVAMKDRNASLCEQIYDPLDRDACYSDLAILMKDGNLCGKIKNDGSRLYCSKRT